MTATTPTPEATLQDLVRGIVLSQGNAFIKELLRDKNLPIGATKADFERNLLDAIDTGEITRGDIEGWLDDVEGWGDQHIYLYNVPAEVSRNPVWKEVEAVKERIDACGLGAFWNAPTSHAFPDQMVLSGIYFDGTALRVSWHRGSDSWVRVPARDFREELEGDLYEYRAYRYRGRRAVTRFVLRTGSNDPKSWSAAVFIPTAINSPEHGELLDAVGRVLRRMENLFSFGGVHRSPVLVANVIRTLDHAHLTRPQGEGPRVTTQTTRLLSGGAYVEFGTLSETDDYGSSAAVRQVRRSIRAPQLPAFIGSSGRVQFLASEASGLGRDVKVQLYGEDKRIRIWRQLSSAEVWTILDALRAHQ